MKLREIVAKLEVLELGYYVVKDIHSGKINHVLFDKDDVFIVELKGTSCKVVMSFPRLDDDVEVTLATLRYEIIRNYEGEKMRSW